MPCRLVRDLQFKDADKFSADVLKTHRHFLFTFKKVFVSCAKINLQKQ